MNKAGNILQLLANSKPMFVLVIPPPTLFSHLAAVSLLILDADYELNDSSDDCSDAIISV